jgi:peptidoglycan hydrolase-like protein with peptidoglycan-binding domain
MNLIDIQTELKSRGLYGGAVDGDFGRLTDAAVEAFLLNKRVDNFDTWGNSRQLIAVQQAIAADRGIEVGKIDGLSGPQTRHAIEVYDARKAAGWKPVPEVEEWRGASDETTPAVEPSHPLPDHTGAPRLASPKQSEVPSFYGPVGSNQVKLTLPFPMRLAWDTSTVVRSFSCHAKVREPLEYVWAMTLKHYGLDEIKRLRLDLFGGCLNVRKMRGGSSWSMHSWGIAWDIDPDHNALKMKRAQATLDAPAYDAYWALVYATGAISLGRERDFDWMHSQYARV